jgi:glycosyltransferase involved in cell wall biosynthesis
VIPTVLYLTYHGLASPLGRAQCLPYLLRLARQGRARLLVISYESDPLPDAALRARVRDAGIAWIELRYHGDPKGLAKIWDLMGGVVAALRLARGRRVDVIHARSYVMAALALPLALLVRAPIVFDMLGMLADEYAEVGHWDRRGFFYRATKLLERVLLRASSALIVLTRRNADYLRASGLVPALTPIQVIPCCVDLERFECANNDGYPRDAAPLLVYAGGLGTWYRLDDMLDLFAVARRVTPDLRFRVITRTDPGVVSAAREARGISGDSVEVISAHPDEMCELLCASDVGISFITPSFSKQAASPNKFAEYLAAGLPVLTNSGVGDLDDSMRGDDIGELVPTFDVGDYERAWRSVVAKLERDPRSLRGRCRAVAARDLSADLAVDRYVQIYDAVAAKTSSATSRSDASR